MNYKYKIFFIFLVIIVCTVLYLYTDTFNILKLQILKLLQTPSNIYFTPASQPSQPSTIQTEEGKQSSTEEAKQPSTVQTAEVKKLSISISNPASTEEQQSSIPNPASIEETKQPSTLILTPASTEVTKQLLTTTEEIKQPLKIKSFFSRMLYPEYNNQVGLKLGIYDINYANNYCYSNNNNNINCNVSRNCEDKDMKQICNEDSNISIEQDNSDAKLFKLKTKDKYCSVDLTNKIIKCDNDVGSKFKIQSVNNMEFILSKYNNYCRTIDKNVYCDTDINNANTFNHNNINNNKLNLDNNSSVDLDKYEIPNSEYKLLSCFNDLPDNKEFPKLALRGTKEECEKYAKDNGYKMYAIQNFNNNDNKVDCMVHDDKKNTSYNKYGYSFDYYVVNNKNIKGLKNTNCVYSSSNDNNNLSSNNINCYDKDNKLINVSRAEAKDKCIISCETTDGTYKSGLFNDIKDQCNRYMSYEREFRNKNPKGERCYAGNNTINKIDTRISDMCLSFEMECKNENNEEFILNSNIDTNERKFKNCKKCKNISTNEYGDMKSLNDIYKCMKFKDSNVTFINKDDTTTQLNLNDSNIESKLTDYGFNIIKCKNPLNENNKTLLSNYGIIKDDGSLHGCGLF